LATNARYALFNVARSAACAAFSSVRAVVAALSEDVAASAAVAADAFVVACAAFSAASAAFAVASCVLSDATCALSATICAPRSDTENVAIADLTAAGSPVAVAAIVASVATTVTVPATAVASVPVAEPNTVTGVTPAAEVTAEVVRVFVIDASENVAPINVTETDSDATGFPNTSVAETEIVGIVPTAVADGTATATFAATPAVPLM